MDVERLLAIRLRAEIRRRHHEPATLSNFVVEARRSIEVALAEQPDFDVRRERVAAILLALGTADPPERKAEKAERRENARQARSSVLRFYGLT